VTYDPHLADRLRELTAPETGIAEKGMFGGLAFLVNGHLAVSASGKGGLLARVDPADAEALVQRPGVQRAIMGGREMPGWLRVDPAALEADADLAGWVDRSVRFARSLPPKRAGG
jgi:hypothetical protein